MRAITFNNGPFTHKDTARVRKVNIRHDCWEIERGRERKVEQKRYAEDDKLFFVAGRLSDLRKKKFKLFLARALNVKNLSNENPTTDVIIELSVNSITCTSY